MSRAGSSFQFRRHSAFVAALLLLGACSDSARAPVPVPSVAHRAEHRTVADEFITTFWCGPPLDAFDDDRAREIAEAGFNLVGASCEGPVTPRLNKRALTVAERHGLKMLIKDGRVSAARPVGDGWQKRANRALAAYRNHDAWAGMFLIDEPNDPAVYADIAALRRRIRQETPGRIGYVNLLPDYVFPGPEDYREYVESYAFQTEPDLLSYDHYPFLNGEDRPSFFENLLVFREVSIEYDTPFLLIVQLMPHADYRDVGDAELAWQVFHALAFGARGISYFAYWTPSQVPDNLAYRFRRGIIEGGLRTDHYERVASLNPRIRAIGEALEGFAPSRLWDSASEFGSDTPPSTIANVVTGEVVVGDFEHPDGRRAALVVNRSYREPSRVRLEGTGDERPRLFDDRARAWSAAPATLELPPGEGRLILRR